MSVEITEASEKYFTARISGLLKPSELGSLQSAGAEFIKLHGKASVLALVDQFEGFAEGQWDHPSLQPKNDDKIEKIAIVGRKRWEELIGMFMGKGYRSVAIEYFTPEELTRAKAWLEL